MNEDRVIGNAKNIDGQMEKGFGRATGDVKSQLQGEAKRVEGALQHAYGQAMEGTADAAEVIRESNSGAEDFLRTTIEELAASVAATILAIDLCSLRVTSSTGAAALRRPGKWLGVRVVGI